MTFFEGQCVGDKEGSHLKVPMTMAITAARSLVVLIVMHLSREKVWLLTYAVIGGNGCGKTVTLCFFDAQLKQFGGRSVFFDRYRGCEVYVRACGGHYSILSPDHPSSLSLNPFQLPNNSKNRQFVKLWMRQLLIDTSIKWILFLCRLFGCG